MKYPKISIITPSYNQGMYIEQTICSVLEQKYPNLEYIIIDGKSSDNTIEIIKKYEKYITYWMSENDMGQSDAINKGYKKASGDVINWLNSDDYYEPGTFQKIAEAFRDPTVNMYSGISRIFGNGTDIYSSGTNVYESLEKTIGWAKIDQPATFFRKTVHDILGSINTNLHYVMDKEFWIRYLMTYGLNGIVKSNDVIINFRLHENSKTVKDHNAFHTEYLNIFYSLAVSNNLVNEATFLQTYYHTDLIQIKYNHLYGDMEKVLHYFIYSEILAAYAMNDKDKYQLFKKILKKEYLNSNDLKQFDKIEFKAKMIPVFLKKIWNKREG